MHGSWFDVVTDLGAASVGLDLDSEAAKGQALSGWAWSLILWVPAWFLRPHAGLVPRP